MPTNPKPSAESIRLATNALLEAIPDAQTPDDEWRALKRSVALALDATRREAIEECERNVVDERLSCHDAMMSLEDPPDDSDAASDWAYCRAIDCAESAIRSLLPPKEPSE